MQGIGLKISWEERMRRIGSIFFKVSFMSWLQTSPFRPSWFIGKWPKTCPKNAIIPTIYFHDFQVSSWFFTVLDWLSRFLSDPSPIIGNACHSLPNWLTDWLTNSCLVHLIDVTLACRDTNSKLVDIVTVADVSDEDRNGNSLLQIWELMID